MAKHERRLQGDFDLLLQTLDREIIGGSVTASFQEGSDYTEGNVRVAVRVYERYSALGGNRLSANITLLGVGESLFLSIITAGGSQAMFFKVNTWGEESFLDKIVQIVDAFSGE